MMLTFLLLAIGLTLVFLEFFIPGAVLGILGSILIVGSVVAFALATTALWAVILFAVGVTILIVFLIRFALARIKKRGNKGIYLNGDQEGYAAVEYPKDQIGKIGQALSDLKPSGHVLVDGQKWQATSTGAYIVKGSEVQVIGGEGAHLIVKQHQKTNS